jgi:hypothetical protein
MLGLAVTAVASSGCNAVRRTLGMEPRAGRQPVQPPTAAFAGMDRMLRAPGDADGQLERIVYPAAGANGTVAVADSAVLLDLVGPAVVRRIRIDLTSPDPHWLRRVALAMYWDDETEPSVHVPLGDFFANGFARTPYASLPLGVAEDGFYSYLPLPFTRRARVVLENGTGLPLEGLTFDADVEREAALAEPVATFHALWSRDPRPEPDRRHQAVDVEGAGWFVGAALSAQGHEGSFAFLGGSGVFRVDGRELEPSELSSYLAVGSGLDTTLAGPLQGVVLKDTQRARVAAYRWHLTDPIPFRTSFRLELERGRANREGAEYATVAYWYQTEPHGALPPLPGPHERRVPDVLVPPGALRSDQLEVVGLGRGAVRLTVPVPRADRYEVVVFPEASPGAAAPRVTVTGSSGPGRTLEVSPPGAEPGDVLAGVVVDTVAATARTLELQLAAGGEGIALPAAVQLRPVAGWVQQWWTIGAWPNLVSDGATALRYVWGPDDDLELDRTHQLPDGRTAAWTAHDGAANGALELAPVGSTAYAQAFLYSPLERDVVLVLESEGARDVRVGGQPAFERPPRPGTAEIELDAHLRAGWNRVLVKLAAADAPGSFRLRAADPRGELVWARSPS